MKFSTLVERMVPLVAELFATLKSNDPLRMDFADIGQKTLLDIVTVLRSEGLTNDDIATTLDLSIAGFYKRVRELRETYAPTKRAKRRTTLWEKAYEVVLQKTGGSPLRGVRYATIQTAMPSVQDERLRSTLRFLVRYGLLTVTGPAAQPEYRVIPRTEAQGVSHHAVVVTLYRDGPLTLAELAERLDGSEAECLPHVDALRAAGKLEEVAPESAGGPTRFRATAYHIEPESEDGFQAALWDHFHTHRARRLQEGAHAPAPVADAGRRRHHLQLRHPHRHAALRRGVGLPGRVAAAHGGLAPARSRPRR
ncbi:MAG: hypothetical protein U1F43_35260 [Myxococcota bacterium]